MNFKELESSLGRIERQTVAVACAADPSVLEAVEITLNKEVASFILYDDAKTLKEMLEAHPLIRESDHVKIEHSDSIKHSVQKAVEAVANGKADVLMKGYVQSSILLKEVLNKEHGLTRGRTLSHVAAFELPGRDRFLFVTDAGMNIQPALEQKVDIINNSVETARAADIDLPKVAVLGAVETVNPKMEATNDAALLAKMNDRGQIKNCIVDGPLALDNAISKEAAEHKKLSGSVAGQADILVVPQIETGNVLYKSLIYFGQGSVGALVTGAKVPIVLTSRADQPTSKAHSILLALKVSQSQ